MSIDGVRRYPGLLEYVSDRFIREEMRGEEAKRYPWVLKYVSVRFKTQEMRNEITRMYRHTLICVSDRFEMKDMCTEEMKRCSGLQEYFSHYYLIQANCNEAASQVGYEGHKQRNALKKQIKMSYYPLHGMYKYGETGAYLKMK